MTRSRRVLLVASSGGYWVQLQRLAPAFSSWERIYVSPQPGYRSEVPEHRFFTVRDAPRRRGSLRLALAMLAIVVRERPRVVISTGALPGYYALRFGKWIGAHTIWVDCAAHAEAMSPAGLRARRFADLWLTQWRHLKRRGGPDHAGSVL